MSTPRGNKRKSATLSDLNFPNQTLHLKDIFKKVKKIEVDENGNRTLNTHRVKVKLTANPNTIKQINMNDMTEEERIKLEDDARTLQFINHPNIIAVKGCFKDMTDNLNIVME